jgi:hypothetical protein
MITEARLYGINDDQNGHTLIRTIHPGQAVNTDALVERLAYVEMAHWLNQKYPGRWCYRYAELVEGVTVETPGVVVSHRLLKDENGKYARGLGGHFVEDPAQPYIDGVTDTSLIADGGFKGQFQWIKGGVGGFVPAYVRTEDPERDARYAAAEQERQEAAEKARQALLAKLETLPQIALAPEQEADWLTWKQINAGDGYSNAVVTFAEQWARLMQAELEPLLAGGKGLPPEKFSEIAERTSQEADAVGLTGFMYGVAVGALAKFWMHGGALRVWHNRQYGYDGDGVVNPAVMTVNVE